MLEKPVLTYKGPIAFGLFALIFLIGGSGFWGYYAQISGAVIATGSIVVDGKPKSIQHLDGGIVKKILIAPGDRVKQNQVLIELDDTSIAANLTIYKGRLRDSLVRKQRLMAELNDQDDFKAPLELGKLLHLGSMQTAVIQQMSLLKARLLTKQTQLAQLDEKVEQFKNQIMGVEGLIKEKTSQIASYDEEIATVRPLVEKGLAAKTRLITLERSNADIRGQILEHRAEILRVKNSISETKLAKLKVEREFREKVITEIEQEETKIDELKQQVEATSKQLSRVVIRSPIAGIVHELNLFTIGGVVQTGQVLMQIIQQSDKHDIELSVPAQSIDQIYVGQKSVVRFPAFHQRTTPELAGQITKISPTSVLDENTGSSFYRISVEIEPRELKRLGEKKLKPGMPVEASIATDQRTVLSYLVKPLTDHLIHVFRER
ncbi:HlyD family type I secretion periplasmic adaptor subunit [Hyphomicrobiales bacterium 4NK60-0047b]